MTKTTEEMIAVMQAHVDGKPIEFKYRGASRTWGIDAHPAWNWADVDYRIAVTKPSIDWSHVAKEYKWLATDKNGATWLYNKEPKKAMSGWGSGGVAIWAISLSSFRPGTCDWEDSFVERPEGI